MTEPADRIRILLVDDEASLLEELAAFLAWHGMAVVNADGAEAALTLLDADPEITVVLTDIRMAGMDGLGLAERILSSRGGEDAVEVVLMTGHGNIETATRAVRAGVFDFLRKPMRLDDLLAVLRRAHAKAAGRRETEIRRLAELSRLRADYAALQARLARAEQPLGLAGDTPPELAHILSHELRTPLVPLLALPDMLETGKALPAGALSAYLGDVRQAGTRLLEIANDLIEFLAPPPSRGFLWRVVPAEGVIDGLSHRIQPSTEAAGVSVTVTTVTARDIETAVPQLVSALARLAANAIAATPAGGRIELSAQDEPDGLIGFTVRDTGAGMTAEDIALARLPFRQLDMSLKRRGGGMGLGLPLAERMAGSLGGRLEIDSAPGTGTCARIILPRRRAGGST